MAGLRYSTFGFGGRMEVGDQGGEEGGWEEGREAGIQGRWPGAHTGESVCSHEGRHFAFFLKNV